MKVILQFSRGKYRPRKINSYEIYLAFYPSNEFGIATLLDLFN
jgi:hypothetical protein